MLQTRRDFRTVLESSLPHRGYLVFNHQKGILSIQTKERNKEYINKDIISLSGGEKSIIQLAFLAALAKRSKSPIHIYDELDVFMDEQNRIKK